MLKDRTGKPVRVVHALPGTGKTTLARSRQDVIDFDDVFESWAGRRVSAEGVDMLLADEKALRKMTAVINDALETGKSFISNLDPATFGLVTDLHIGFANLEDYVRHLEQVGRHDVINIGLNVLEGWVADYPKDRFYALQPGQVLSDLKWT